MIKFVFMINALLVAALFFLTFVLNSYFFEFFTIDDYVSLVFLPSGVRIFSVLVFEFYGALGIFLGSLAVSFFYLAQTDIEVAVMAAVIAAGTALLSRKLCLPLLKLDANLREITLTEIIKVCLVFSLLSAVGHQVFYQVVGIGTHLASDAFKMFIGDICGAIVFLVSAKFVVELNRLYK
jgi:hypothetical protein